MLLSLRYCLPLIPTRLESIEASKKWPRSYIICEQKGPRPRYPRVWKTKTKIGTISKAAKLVDCIKGLSNVKEEVYGALDSFVAWDLEFPLVTVKKALRTLEHQQEWKRIIQVSKWMLNKGQGRTMGTYFILLNALAEDERLEEAEELWNKLFMRYLESMPRKFFDKMMSIYYKRDLHDKMFEVQPSVSIVNMVGTVFQHRGMVDKYEKLKAKYPPPKWEYRYIKGKRVRIRAKHYREYDSERRGGNKEEGNLDGSREMDENSVDDDENVEESSDGEETSLSLTEFDEELEDQLGRDTNGGSRNEGSSRSVDETAFVSYQQSIGVDEAS